MEFWPAEPPGASQGSAGGGSDGTSLLFDLAFTAAEPSWATPEIDVPFAFGATDELVTPPTATDGTSGSGSRSTSSGSPSSQGYSPPGNAQPAMYTLLGTVSADFVVPGNDVDVYLSGDGTSPENSVEDQPAVPVATRGKAAAPKPKAPVSGGRRKSQNAQPAPAPPPPSQQFRFQQYQQFDHFQQFSEAQPAQPYTADEHTYSMFANAEAVPVKTDDSGSDDPGARHGDEEFEGMDEEVFKQRHNASERKRQAVINDAIGTLKNLINIGSSDKRLSKGAVLRKAVDHIQSQNSACSRTRKEVAVLRRENQNMSKHIHLLRAILTSNNLPAPNYTPTTVDDSVDFKAVSSLEHGLPQAPPLSAGRRVAALMSVIFFCTGMYVATSAHVSIDGEFFTTRALQAFNLRSETDSVNSFLLLTVHMIEDQFMSALLSIAGAFIRVLLLFVLASGLLQFLVPIVNATDPLLSIAHHHATVGERHFKDGAVDVALTESIEGLRVLGFVHDVRKMDGFFAAFPVACALVYETLRHISHLLMIGLLVERMIVSVRRSERYNYELASLAMMRAQCNWLAHFHDGQNANIALVSFYYMLLALNSSAVINKAGVSLYSHACVTFGWLFLLATNRWNFVVTLPLSRMYRYLGWQSSSQVDGSQSQITVGRFYFTLGVDHLSQGRLTEASYNLLHAIEMHKAADAPVFWRMSALMLSLVYLYQSELTKAKKMLGTVQYDIHRASDNRFVVFLSLARAMVLLGHATCRSDERRALAILTEADTKRAGLLTTANDSWQQKSQAMVQVPLAVARARCGDALGAYELIKDFDAARLLRTSFADSPLVEFYCEATLLLLEAKLHDTIAGPKLPELRVLEDMSSLAMERLLSHATLYKILQPAHLILTAHFDFIHQRHDMARSKLTRAVKAAQEMAMPSYERRAAVALEELQRHVALHKNFSSLLSVQV